jgi:hypothetical protein
LDTPIRPWLYPADNKTNGRIETNTLILVGALALIATAAQAQSTNQNSHPVQGYTNSSGTYVQPHMQTNPNYTQRDNYSAYGDVNPYTGAAGTRNPQR